MERKICIITGANAGIGKQAAFQIADKGYHVIMACRNEGRGAAALSALKKELPAASAELRIVDLGLRESILRFADEFNHDFDHLDVLIHNAAIFNITQKKRILTAEGIEEIWATNHLGPVLLTRLLLEKMGKSDDSRIITISSKGLLAKPFMQVDLKDVEFQSKRFNVVNAYYQSKIAQNIFTLWLANRLHNTNIAVNCIRVPAVKIDISRHPGLSEFMKWVYEIKARKSLSPEAMAKIYTEIATSEKYRNIKGKFYNERLCDVSPSGYCSQYGNIRSVMTLTKKYLPELGEI